VRVAGSTEPSAVASVKQVGTSCTSPLSITRRLDREVPRRYDPVERSESVEAPLVFVGDKLPSRGAFDVLPLVEDLA
jgi:hypothetical protein